MAKRKRKKSKSKIKKNKNRSYLFISLGLFFLLAVGLVALLKKNQIMYYYTMYFGAGTYQLGETHHLKWRYPIRIHRITSHYGQRWKGQALYPLLGKS